MSRRSFYLIYTGLFALFASVALWYVFASGGSLIWNGDGLDQHLTFFTYAGEWIRTALVSGTLPMWNYDMGYGSDTICTMAMWIGDPFNLFSAICPVRYSEYMYQAVAVLRLYLAGIAFLCFARYHRRDDFACLCGAMIYTFSGYLLLYGVLRHPIFLNPAILLPLVLLGADKILNGESPSTFIIFMAFTFFIFFYFAYMICVFLVLYCLIRYLTSNRDKSALDFLRLLGRFVLYSLIGFCAAGILIVPILMYLLQMGRLSAQVYVPPTESLTFYLHYPLTLTGIDTRLSGLGIGIVAVFCAFVMYLAQVARNDRSLLTIKIVFAAVVIFSLFPFFGHVLNGFSYSCERWMFAFSFAGAYVATSVIPLLPDLSRKDWIRISIVYGIFVLLLFGTFTLKSITGIELRKTLAIVVIALSITLPVVIWLANRTGAERVMRSALMACLLISIGSFCYVRLAAPESTKDTTSKADEMVRFGGAYSSLIGDSPVAILNSIDDPTLWRSDRSIDAGLSNAYLLAGQMGIDFYSSMYSQRVDTWRTQLALSQGLTRIQTHRYRDNDDRAYVEAISSVKYYLQSQNDLSNPPYGFDNLISQVSSDNCKYSIYENRDYLPLAFVYDHSIPVDVYESMTPIQRQEALLQGCVIDNVTESTITPSTASVEAPYTVQNAEDSGITISADKIEVTKANAQLTLTFEGVPDSEIYIYFSQLDYERYYPSDQISDTEKTAQSQLDRLRLIKRDLMTSDQTTFKLGFSSQTAQSKILIGDNERENFYAGKNCWLVNLGCSQDAQTSVTITFVSKGTYTFDSLQVLCQPMGSLDRQVAALRADPVENLSFDTNRITGSVDLDAQKLLYLSVPWSEGWTAYVDGEQVDLRCANTAFMAVDMPVGQHSFELRYETPYLKLGALFSCLGIIAFVTVTVRWRRRRRTSPPPLSSR